MYVVSGAHDASGTIKDDSSNLKVYYELGWECVVSNIEIKDLLHQGKISKSDVIVTGKDRKFIYSSVFDNVIDWDYFKSLNVSKDECFYIDHFKALERIESPQFTPNKDLYCNFDLIQNIEKKYNIDSDFICYCVRLRSHANYRNSSISVAKETIEYISSKYNMKVFLVGKGSEELSNGKNLISVGLNEFASLMNSKYCKCCVSKLSGIIHLANFCGHENLINLIYDPSRDREIANRRCLWMGDNINYKNVENIFIEMPESKKITVDIFEKYVLNNNFDNYEIQI